MLYRLLLSRHLLYINNAALITTRVYCSPKYECALLLKNMNLGKTNNNTAVMGQNQGQNISANQTQERSPPPSGQEAL